MRPSLQLVLRGDIACEWGLPVASRGPAYPWMLSLEPFSMRNPEPTSRRDRLAVRSAYALSVTTLLCRFGSYTSSCFHIDSTIAAMRRASVSFAKFGLIPDFSMR